MGIKMGKLAKIGILKIASRGLSTVTALIALLVGMIIFVGGYITYMSLPRLIDANLSIVRVLNVHSQLTLSAAYILTTLEIILLYLITRQGVLHATNRWGGRA